LICFLTSEKTFFSEVNTQPTVKKTHHGKQKMSGLPEPEVGRISKLCNNSFYIETSISLIVKQRLLKISLSEVEALLSKSVFM